MSQYGEMLPLDEAFGRYIGRWYAQLYGDTQATAEFAARGLAKAVKMAPGRMIDNVESMIQAYQRDQQGPHGKNATLPVVMVALARDYIATLGEWGGRQLPRTLGVFTVAEGAIEGAPPSWYGMRTAMHDVRAQIVVIAADKHSARSLAAQLGLYLGDMANRHFKAVHTFGQYRIETPVTLENSDIAFMVAGETKTMTILAGDITLKVQTPFFDAPKLGQLNDGSSNNPPGYPLVNGVVLDNYGLQRTGETDADGTHWNDA
ncbi:hypothetical protein BJP27_24015 (plasmid) [Pseudomonas oryzihabitans]|nr:hypothetical protein BJP27_24015 [Pseudomonas psychrotolerans]